jgi:DNA-binding NarL/FixJ family response regulator
MPEMDGVEAVRQIRRHWPEIKIIMLSTYHEDELVRSALLAGASGYLLKDISPTELIAAIRALKSGIVQISPEIARALVAERYRRDGAVRQGRIAPEFHGGHGQDEYKSESGYRETPGPGRQEAGQSGGDGGSPFEWLNDLTPREREIFTLIATGYDNEQIASTLNLAVQTVRNQVSTIYSKLGVKDRFEIIRLANKR